MRNFSALNFGHPFYVQLPLPRQRADIMFRVVRQRLAVPAPTALRPARLHLSARCYSDVFDRYKAQLQAKAQKEGVSVEELLQKSAAKSTEVYDPLDLVTKANANQEKKSAQTTEEPKTPLEAVARAASTASTSAKTKDLSTFVDVEALRKHDAKEIEMIWKARFVNKQTEFCGALNSDAYSRVYVNARKYPTFVLPLPQGEGVELYYSQWSFVGNYTIHCLITPLAEYKLHQEYAHPRVSLMLHSDFLTDKGIALHNAALQDNEISMDNAVLLTLNLLRFYTADPTASEHSRVKVDLLRQFNTGDTSFSADRLIEATETLD